MSTNVFPRMAAAAGLVLALARPAFAADWQYCLAPFEAAHTVYMSGTFLAHGDARAADAIFANTLAQAGLPYDTVQCPRADDEETITVMLLNALRYNRDMGNRVVSLPARPGR